MDIYIHGHGNYHPRYGYTNVPQGFKISFYTHFAKTLSGSTVYPFLSGTLAPEIERTLDEHQRVPNMHYSQLPDLQRQAANQANTQNLQLFMPNADMFLSQIFAGFANQMHAGIQRANAAGRVQRERMERERANAPDPDQVAVPARPHVHLHWLCCQTLALTRAGGRKVGVNAQDMRHNPQHLDQYRFNWNDETGAAREEFVRISGHHT